ncbi:hypothetical protein VP01_8152g1 [Puccinia sorghi]|uniref:Uncharacterized protein n=1 Tax=Puccinia sorghi TaxID=27349 RepID=A0A0L6UA81_9BASI|nr:hypothetical protein VP01_8152g1 [Puccinia sorghi]
MTAGYVDVRTLIEHADIQQNVVGLNDTTNTIKNSICWQRAEPTPEEVQQVFHEDHFWHLPEVFPKVWL